MDFTGRSGLEDSAARASLLYVEEVAIDIEDLERDECPRCWLEQGRRRQGTLVETRVNASTCRWGCGQESSTAEA